MAIKNEVPELLSVDDVDGLDVSRGSAAIINRIGGHT
jgi:hypothetical protein